MLKVLLVCAVLASVAFATTSGSKDLEPAGKTVPVKPKRVRTFEPTYAPDPVPPEEQKEKECKPCSKKAPAPPVKPEPKGFVPELTDGKLVRHPKRRNTKAEPRTFEPEFVPEPVPEEKDKDGKPAPKKEDKDRLPVVAEIKPEPPKRWRRFSKTKPGAQRERWMKRFARYGGRRVRDDDDEEDDGNNDNDYKRRHRWNREPETIPPPDMSGSTDGPVISYARPVHGGLDDRDRVVDDATSADPEVPGSAGKEDIDTPEPESPKKEDAPTRAADDDKDDDKEDTDSDDDEKPAAPAAPAAAAADPQDHKHL